MRIRFVTATPLDVRRGSGTFVGMHVLARALGELGHEVQFAAPRLHLGIFTAERLLFNLSLSRDPRFDVSVGFDMDGYRIPDVAALKGVIADEVRFESGLTAFTMGIQARCERLHVHRARQVLATSRYAAESARELYGMARLPAIVPELIDLKQWRGLLERCPAASPRFTVLFVGRFYRRKRVDVLLRAAAALGARIPELEVRIVGNGPCGEGWRRLGRELKLDGVVTWLGDVTRAELAAEFNRAHVFCLPSVQEGFGIVLLEAMAAGLPIVAARAAAIPEVARHSVLVERENTEALAAGIEGMYRSEEQRVVQSKAGAAWVEQFDSVHVARQFLEAIMPTRANGAGA